MIAGLLTAAATTLSAQPLLVKPVPVEPVAAAPMICPASPASPIVVQGGREGIVVQGGREGIVVQGGREAFGGQSTNLALGPKQGTPSPPVLAGGVNQHPEDDGGGRGGGGAGGGAGPKLEYRTSPIAVGALARPGDGNDPQAFGGQGTNLTSGRKQDPRAPVVHAIGGGCGPTDGPIPAPR
ncbi:MAG TPA: hypothetical protein VNA29_02120 [Sphingomicrobium sp.]|nr:hypothetical protein [Sphingomicrobium sp.]